MNTKPARHSNCCVLLGLDSKLDNAELGNELVRFHRSGCAVGVARLWRWKRWVAFLHDLLVRVLERKPCSWLWVRCQFRLALPCTVVAWGRPPRRLMKVPTINYDFTMDIEF